MRIFIFMNVKKGSVINRGEYELERITILQKRVNSIYKIHEILDETIIKFYLLHI